MECRQISHKKKLKQLEETYDAFELMLKREGFIAYGKGITFDDDAEIKHYINHNIDVAKYLNTSYGESINCLRPSCNNAYGANIFKTKDNTTLYKCHLDCNCADENDNATVSIFEVIYEVFKQQHQLVKFDNYYAVMYQIKMLFCADYESEFYKEFREIIEHNRALILNLHHKKYLAQLFKKRNLLELYMFFTELALIYMKADEEIPYSFYCSNTTIKRTFKYVFETSCSNYQIDKINILVALGLLEKLDEDSCSKRMRDKIIKAKMIASQGKPFLLKSTSAYKIKKLTIEDIEKAERLAKIILENKIYIVKADTFKQIESQNKKDAQRNETFIKRAKKAIKDEMKAKGYVQLNKLVSKIDTKYKYYKKKTEKEELLNINIKRIMSDYKLEIILVNDEARKYFGLTKSVKDGSELLIKKDDKFNNKLKSDKNDELFIEAVEEINGKTEVMKLKKIDASDAPF